MLSTTLAMIVTPLIILHSPLLLPAGQEVSAYVLDYNERNQMSLTQWADWEVEAAAMQDDNGVLALQVRASLHEVSYMRGKLITHTYGVSCVKILTMRPIWVSTHEETDHAWSTHAYKEGGLESGVQACDTCRLGSGVAVFSSACTS